MLQLNNSTPFAAKMALFPDHEAIDTLFVMVRASFNIGPKWTLADEQPIPFEADVYWGDPESSSLKYGADYHVGKPYTDVAMIGFACAAGRQAVKQMDVGLGVGEMQKTVRVFGDRQWSGGAITAPQLFETMPMVYEKAYGGKHLVNDVIESIDERNPVGCGFAGERGVLEMDGVPLPNLEDPKHLITRTSDSPFPAGFGFCAPAWRPRFEFAGTYDETWQTQRAPYLPEDFDPRFLNMAHPDLICKNYLRGGERVTISGMHPNGEIDFELPRIELKLQVKQGTHLEQVNFCLETLLLEPNQYQLSLVWKAAYPCDKRAHKIDRVDVGLKH